MRKQKLLNKKSLKSIIAVALVAAMALPVTSAFKTVEADEAAYTDIVPARLLDFNEGLKEYYSDDDLKLDIVKTEDLFVYKPEAERETSDRVDANDILVQGEGASAFYKKYTVSNQPSTYVDDEMGTVLWMGKTVNLDAVKKENSASMGLEAVKMIDPTDETGKKTVKIYVDKDVQRVFVTEGAVLLEGVKDNKGDEIYVTEACNVVDEKAEGAVELKQADAATRALDKSVPYGEGNVIQEAMTVKSELNINNPIADSTEKFSVSMWLNIPKVDGVDNALAGAWHYVAVTVDGDNKAYYVDGEAKEDTSVADLIKTWVSSEKVSIGGDTDSAKAFSEAFGITDANAAVKIDDIAFYKDVVSAEQIKSKYEENKKETTPVAKKLTISSFSDASKLESGDFPGVGKAATAISTGKDTVNGKTTEVINIPENKKTSQMTGAYIKNPFAGKDLDGATISFWVKQDKRSSKTSTGDEATPWFSIVDTTKSLYHEKSNAKGDVWSIISASSAIGADFKEAFSDDSVGNSLKNSYSYVTSEEDKAKVQLMEWNNVTLVMNNSSIKVYVNGVYYPNDRLDDNGKSIAAGVRFLDGTYQRMDDETDMKTKYNIFGGSNNQYATALMSFLKYDDTTLLLGYKPTSGTQNCKTNPTSFAEIRVFETDLTEEQVKALYQDCTVYDENGSGGSTEKPSEGVVGDADGDGTVTLTDVMIILKHAVGIENIQDSQNFKNADTDGDNSITLTDCMNALKIAIGIN